MSLKNEEELKAFFRDIMSERDLRELQMRWGVAKKLDAGVPFSQIQEEFGQSPVTITKINRWLTEGCGGYKMMIEKKGISSCLLLNKRLFILSLARTLITK